MNNYRIAMLVTLQLTCVTGAGLIAGWMAAFIVSVCAFVIAFFLEMRDPT